MTREVQWNQESTLLARAQMWLPELEGFERGDATRGEPDAVIRRRTARPLGIEVTLLPHPDTESGFSGAQIEAARREIAQRAQAMHLESGASPVYVNAYLGDGPYATEAAARFLVQAVQATSVRGETINVEYAPPQAPVHMAFSVWDPDPGTHASWRCRGGGPTPSLDFGTIRRAIARKQAKLARYRRACDEVWLLIVSPFFPSWVSWVCPDDAREWRFEHGFDRIYLHCHENAAPLLLRREGH